MLHYVSWVLSGNSSMTSDRLGKGQTWLRRCTCGDAFHPGAGQYMSRGIILLLPLWNSVQYVGKDLPDQK